jgi:hypothetical protein
MISKSYDERTNFIFLESWRINFVYFNKFKDQLGANKSFRTKIFFLQEV